MARRKKLSAIADALNTSLGPEWVETSALRWSRVTECASFYLNLKRGPSLEFVRETAVGDVWASSLPIRLETIDVVKALVNTGVEDTLAEMGYIT